MRRKEPVPFTHKFPNIDPVALKLLQRLVAFDPKDRPSAEEVRRAKAELFSFIFMILDAFGLLLSLGIG